MSASSPYSGRLAELAVSFALILFLVSCAGPSWDGRYREAMDRVIPDMQRCSLRTPRYVVYSDAGQTRVVPVADLMEQAADAYDRLLDIDTSEEEKNPPSMFTERGNGLLSSRKASVFRHPSGPSTRRSLPRPSMYCSTKRHSITLRPCSSTRVFTSGLISTAGFQARVPVTTPPPQNGTPSVCPCG
ncbi:MAG: hypothetical protein AVO39_05870 [delta proteobacterium MLS_D]|jgi:hypothetical protein|nr:MAG: hypothetical protein AVO39_05870 [delta proteobacterium MLS_D]